MTIKNLNKTAQGIVSFATIVILLVSVLASSIYFEYSITANAVKETAINTKPTITIKEVKDINKLNYLNEGWYEIKNGYVYYLESFNDYVPLYIQVINPQQQNGLMVIYADGEILFDESFRGSSRSQFVADEKEDKNSDEESTQNQITGKVTGMGGVSGFTITKDPKVKSIKINDVFGSNNLYLSWNQNKNVWQYNSCDYSCSGWVDITRGISNNLPGLDFTYDKFEKEVIKKLEGTNQESGNKYFQEIGKLNTITVTLPQQAQTPTPSIPAASPGTVPAPVATATTSGSAGTTYEARKIIEGVSTIDYTYEKDKTATAREVVEKAFGGKFDDTIAQNINKQFEFNIGKETAVLAKDNNGKYEFFRKEDVRDDGNINPDAKRIKMSQDTKITVVEKPLTEGESRIRLQSPEVGAQSSSSSTSDGSQPNPGEESQRVSTSTNTQIGTISNDYINPPNGKTFYVNPDENNKIYTDKDKAKCGANCVPVPPGHAYDAVFKTAVPLAGAKGSAKVGGGIVKSAVFIGDNGNVPVILYEKDENNLQTLVIGKAGGKLGEEFKVNSELLAGFDLSSMIKIDAQNIRDGKLRFETKDKKIEFDKKRDSQKRTDTEYKGITRIKDTETIIITDESLRAIGSIRIEKVFEDKYEGDFQFIKSSREIYTDKASGVKIERIFENNQIKSVTAEKEGKKITIDSGFENFVGHQKYLSELTEDKRKEIALFLGEAASQGLESAKIDDLGGDVYSVGDTKGKHIRLSAIDKTIVSRSGDDVIGYININTGERVAIEGKAYYIGGTEGYRLIEGATAYITKKDKDGKITSQRVEQLTSFGEVIGEYVGDKIRITIKKDDGTTPTYTMSKEPISDPGGPLDGMILIERSGGEPIYLDSGQTGFGFPFGGTFLTLYSGSAKFYELVDGQLKPVSTPEVQAIKSNLDKQLAREGKITSEQASSQSFFANVERVFSEFSGLRYYDTLFFDEDSLLAWRDGVDRAFATLYLGTEYWSSALCSTYLDGEDEGIAYAETPQGLAQIGAHVEASRTEQIITDKGREFIYKITFSIRNGDFANDPRAPKEMNFNVVLRGETAASVFKQEQKVKRGSTFSRTGKNAIVQESRFFYNQICINFDEIPLRWKLDDKELCNTIVESAGEATPLTASAGSTATTTSGSGASESDINDF